MYRFPRISLKSNRLVRQLKNSTFLDEYFKSVLRIIETVKILVHYFYAKKNVGSF